MPKRKDSDPPNDTPVHQFMGDLIYTMGLKPYEVAKAAGVSDRFFRNWLSGTYGSKNDEMIEKAAKFLGVLPSRVLSMPRKNGEE